MVMSFAYSHRPLTDLLERNFVGEWKYLSKAIFEIGEQKANRAITELAVLLRILDDEEEISGYYKQTERTWNCGRLVLNSGETVDLSFREFSNKIIHAKTFKWVFSANDPPMLICYAREDDPRKWNRADVDLVSLAGYCGQFMS
jgi:hypothetical protein